MCDWDGTLADSVQVIIKCKKYLARKYKLLVPAEDVIKSVLGMQFEQAIRICFPNIPPKIFNLFCSDFHVCMKEARFRAKLFHGAKISLRALQRKGVKLAIASSKDPEELVQAIKQSSLEVLFPVTCCSSNYLPKPNPSMLHYLLNKFSITPDECVMIGDTIFDMQFAQNAGVDVIAVTFGAHTKDQLQLYSPVAFMDSWTQLSNIMESLWHSNLVSSPLSSQAS